MQRLIRLCMLLCAFALVGAACGNDDGGGTEASADVDASVDVDADGDSDSDSDPGEQSNEDQAEDVLASQLGPQCAFLAEFASGIGSSMDLTSSNPFAGLASLAEELQEVADAAPDEIRSDMQILASAIGEVADELADIEFDPSNPDPEVLAAMEGLAEVFDNPEVEAASENVEAWLDANCSGN